MNKYIGRVFDDEHIVVTAMYLEGTALMRYNDNIDGINCQKTILSFKYVISGLYDCFIHSKALSKAVDKFWTMTYKPEKGVMPFYYKLT